MSRRCWSNPVAYDDMETRLNSEVIQEPADVFTSSKYEMTVIVGMG